MRRLRCGGDDLADGQRDGRGGDVGVAYGVAVARALVEAGVRMARGDGRVQHPPGGIDGGDRLDAERSDRGVDGGQRLVDRGHS